MKYLKLFEGREDRFQKDVEEIKGYLHDLQDMGFEITIDKQRGSLGNIDIVGESESINNFNIVEMSSAVDELMNRVQDLGYRMFIHDFNSKGTNENIGGKWGQKVNQSFRLRFAKVDLDIEEVEVPDVKTVDEFISAVYTTLNIDRPVELTEWPAGRSGRQYKLTQIDIVESIHEQSYASFGLELNIWHDGFFEFSCPLIDNMEDKLSPGTFKKLRNAIYTPKEEETVKYKTNKDGLYILMWVTKTITDALDL